MSASEWTICRAPELAPSVSPGQVRLAGVQCAPLIGEVETNIEAAVDALRAAQAAGATWVVFPECAATGYCFSDPEEAGAAALAADDPRWEPFTSELTRLNLHAVMGYLERTPQGMANAATLWGPGGAVGHYRKTHLPHLGVDKFTQPGTAPLAVVEAGGLRVGMLICFDASFPEATRLLALAGADLVVLPTNWPREAEHKAAWLPNARAYENVVYFASINRVGDERGYHFSGLSRVCDPTGQVLVEGPRDRPALLIADIDPARARTKRIVRREGEYWLDRIGQRRGDLYRLLPADEGDSA